MWMVTRNYSHVGTINLVWLGVPIAVVLSVLLGYVWTQVLEQPERDVDQYFVAVILYGLSAVLVLMAESFYIVGQALLHVSFRSAIDLLYPCANTLSLSLVVAVAPDKAVLYGAYFYAFNSFLYLAIQASYYGYLIRTQKHKKDDDDETDLCRIPFKSLAEFLPDLSEFQVDVARLSLSLSFLKQCFLKQILTEGEKYVFTWFSLLTLPEQGVYDVVSNLGSIPARLFFEKLEECARLYFSQTVTRGEQDDLRKEEEPTRHLHLLIKGLVLFGLVVCAFGVSYSHLLLHIYGGTILSSGPGPNLMRAMCVYVLFLAVNGVTECYSFCVMTSKQVSAYNYRMAVMTMIFLACTWVFAKLMGPVGFTVANICNFAMRIIHNLQVISRRHRNGHINPLAQIWPSKPTLIMLAVATLGCHLSETHVYDPMQVWKAVAHVAIGAALFAASLLTIVRSEDYMYQAMLKLFRSKEKAT